MLYCQNSCTTLESKHYNLVSDFNTVHGILYHFCNLEERLIISTKRQEKQQQNISSLLFQFIKCSWSWLGDFIFGPVPQKSHAVRIGLCAGHSFSRRRPIHRRGKWLSTVTVDMAACTKLHATFCDSCAIWKPTHYRFVTNVFALVTQ
jgi:hypothetical protein